jgi:2'-5' RNA ligase
MRPRESAIDIGLPELAELVDHWRMPTVPVASQGVPPHITLLYPWRPAPLHPEDLHDVAAAVAGVAPFTLTFQQVGHFPGALFLSPEPEGVLRNLTRRLVRAFPETPPYGGQFGADPTPHLTIALAETEAELNRLETEIRACLEPRFPLQVPVHALSLEEEGTDGTWQIWATIELSGS